MLRLAATFGAVATLIAGIQAPAAHALPMIPTRNLDLKAHFNDFPPAAGIYLGSGYASCWHYVHSDGREYAVIGYTRGTAIYNVTDPDNAFFVDSIPGPISLWREMKSYRNWIYVVTEAQGGNGQPAGGVQIIRMTDPENPVLAATYSTDFITSHTVSVDTSRALLFCNGTRGTSGQTGVRILSLASPEAPIEVGRWPAEFTNNAQYVHDSAIRGNRLFASSIYVGTVRIIDITNPATPIQTAEFTYPGAYYAHNSWPDSTGNFLYVTDEQNGQTLRVLDISNPGETFKIPVSEWTSNPQAIVHNAHVKGQELWLANYTEGIRVLDVTDPAHPAEYGWADTRPGAAGGFSGVWGVDPYFPSGTVIASDMQTGLYVFRPVRNYGRVRVEVIDAATDQPADSAQVRIPSQGDSARTFASGIAMFAPSPGMHFVEVRKFGYATVTLPALVAQGSNDTLRVALVRKPTANLMGIVRDAVTQTVLADAEVNLRWTPVHAHAAGDGAYHLHDVPDDLYRVDVRRPGYIPVSFERRIGPGFDGNQDFQLAPVAMWETFAEAPGWSVSGVAAGAEFGRWELAEPRGSSIDGGGAPPGPNRGATAFGWARDLELAGIKPGPRPFHEGHESEGATPGQVQPEYDRSPAPDSLCFVTGNADASGLDIGLADVDNSTILTSAAFDMSGMTDPTIGVWLWFYSQFRSPDDLLAIEISNDNGSSWMPVDTLRGIHNHWEERAIHVADYVPPSALVKLRFTAVDGGEQSIVEAAIDDITTYDGAVTPVGVIAGADPVRLSFRRVWPNPARERTNFVLALPAAGPADVDVLDVAGRHVRVLHRGRVRAGTLTLQWDGADDAGRRAAAGLYFARARTEQGTTEARFVRMP